eukprot:superscaffoldBa00000648_g6297
MFTTYIKSLNDMVFPTSENPEEQPSTGVLGRIGSWFSPWKGKSSKNPNENAFPTSDQAVKLEAEGESEEPVRRQAREQQWEEEKEHSSNPNSLGLHREIFLCEEEDATQSAHRDGFVVSSSETGEGGPKEEESVVCRRKRIGQGKEREESSNGTSVSGNPENASHLTHLSSCSEQGVVWESDQAHTQPEAQKQAHAQAGRRLHVYLEETSVIHCGQDTCAGQEVVRTKIKKSLQVLPKAKSSPSFDSSKSLSSTSTENKRLNVRPAVGAQNYYSAVEGVSLKSPKDLQLEPEPYQEQTEADSMGRKNAARKKCRKNSQGDGGSSPQEQIPSNAQPVSEGCPTSDNSVNSPQGKSPIHMGESPVNSSTKPNPTSQVSPGGVESKTSCPDSAKHLANFQDSNSVILATRACVVEGGADMEDDDSFYKVERKTETPESKRRSMKVSRSEVKLFSKNVPFNAEQSSAEDDLDFKAALKITKNEAKDKTKTEIHARLQDLKKLDEEPKPAVGRIGDKISLFERQAMGGRKQTFQSPRSADVSPVRKATERLKKDLVLSDQRSRSAERCGTAGSRSASPVTEKPMTIKERVKNLFEASVTAEKAALPQKPTMTGMSQKSTSSATVAASKSPELESQGKQDTKEQIATIALSETTLKPDGRDTTDRGLCTVKKEPVNNKPNQTVKAPPSSKANKLIPDSMQCSSMKKLNLPRGLSRDDSAIRQDAPSSWLDVDFPKRKLKVMAPKLSSSGSESNLLDTSGELDDEEFVEKIKKLCAPFSLPPRKHNHLRPPQPAFAMPAIKEDHFEKTFDLEEFKFGLRKNNFVLDTSTNLFDKLQSSDTKTGLRPVRASLADRSILLNSLDTHSRLKDKSPVKDEEDVKEERDEHFKVKSRLEGSCVFSSLTSSSRGKRNGAQTQAEGTKSGDASPSEGPLPSPTLLSQPPLPSPTATAPLKNTLSKQSLAPGDREEAQAVEAVVSDSVPPLPSFNNIKLPDYLEKYLPREPAKPVQSIQGQDQANTEIRTARGFHKRPGKMVLFEKAQFCGQSYDICRDIADATSMRLSPLISVKVIRGCWVLYEKPDFQGRSIALEEGGTELTNEWAESGLETEPHNNLPMLIGSIRLAVSDYNIPHIDLFTEPEGHGRVTPYHDDAIETGSFGIPLSTASIQVHSGVWLVFSDVGFQGMLAVLETGVYPYPETWGFPSPFVGSLRPLKMGGYKVENPNEVKAVVYEKPGFEGTCLEIDSDIFSFCESEGANLEPKKLTSVGSIKIIGGLWVGYSQPGFEGQQYILEEGEYLDCNDWGGSEQLLSLRPILSDFMSPHLKMFSDRDFGELGVSIDVRVPIINMDDTGYGMRTQSIDVMGGVWVVFEEPGFCGECYILEKGLYGSPEDWGALQPRIASAMPIVLDDFENAAKFKVQLFSDPGFQGSVLALEDSVTSLQEGFSVASCKVLAGSWLAFEGQDFTDRMYVLEVGNYPDLRAMGCVNASSSILSLQPVGFEFSLPSITLFERYGLRGKRVVLTNGSVNLQLAGGCGRVQSVLVEGGMWVLYEGVNYRGAQILLKPGEVHDWHQISNWKKIGSLRPLLQQKQVHFHLRNRQTGLMMSVTGDLDDIKLLRIQEMEETDGFEQIWFYQNGHLHCKLLEECCLSPSGSVTIAGSRTGLTPEQDDQAHFWSITPEGFIRYTPTSDLVLEVKGGHHFDKNQVILNTLDPNKLTQMWDVEII